MKHKKGNNVNGWLIIDKPQGMGSTQVVNFTRRFFNAKKNCHAGTLDPFATGVLPIAFGEGTKLIDFITDGDKEYEFTLSFGSETDSSDCTGNITVSGGKTPTKEEIISVIPNFIGKIKQTPPVFSAIKINGQRAYDLARKGEDVSIPEREIEVFGLELTDTKDNLAFFRVQCSKGTYVRSLGRDIARSLNTYGHLTELRRTKCGLFTINDTILLEKLKNLVYVEQANEFLLPLETSLRDIAVMAVSEADAEKLKHGQALSPKVWEGKFPLQTMVATTCNGVLTAMVLVEETRLSPIRVFNLT